MSLYPAGSKGRGRYRLVFTIINQIFSLHAMHLLRQCAIGDAVYAHGTTPMRVFEIVTKYQTE